MLNFATDSYHSNSHRGKKADLKSEAAVNSSSSVANYLKDDRVSLQHYSVAKTADTSSSHSHGFANFSHNRAHALRAFLQQGKSKTNSNAQDLEQNFVGLGADIYPQNSLEHNAQAVDEAQARNVNGQPLSEEDLLKIRELKDRQQEVIAHETSHKVVGGSYASHPEYTYETGPDGKRYITDGKVSIDVSEIDDDPRATIFKMQRVRASALAPAEPSSADRSVAAEASLKEMQARNQLQEESHNLHRENGASIQEFNDEHISKSEQKLEAQLESD